jgi:hypothetical protein
MIYRTVRNVTLAFICSGFVSFAFAQSNSSKIPSTSAEKTEKKPFKILTTGKKITVQSSKNIKTVLVWTASGNRIIEQQELNVLNYSFEIPAKEKIFFLRIELGNGKMYTEKVGVQ